jgi:hypothetical protein
VADPLSFEGHSGYLSRPDVALDPALFEDDRLKINVSKDIITDFKQWLFTASIKGDDWSHLWITGSSITYQYGGDRGTGDLDVMVGVNFQKFLASNPEFDGWSVQDLSSWMNQKMLNELWPKTAHTKFNGKEFEVTFYFNTTVSDDIKVIHPYAAYDLTDDYWVVKPPELPSNPGTLYAQGWYDAADRDTESARELVAKYSMSLSQMEAAAPGTPDWHNAGAKLHVTLAQAGEMYNGIHAGRKESFASVHGQGYGDWHNFRYQRAKASGTMGALNALNQIGKASHEAEETALYGAPLEAADVVLRRAAMMYRNQPS